ncbi:MAG TPA: hypothetical protein VGQ17_17890 [Gemmatimonadales bacterium]|jgi:hypothetical protein|nr:hypothetical protein [Gemmatimonadales bacterium]
MTRSLRLLALAAALLVPQALNAQACLGAPQTEHGWVGARLALTSLEQGLFGGEAGWRTGGAVIARAQIDRVGFDDKTPSRRRGQIGVLVDGQTWKLPVCFTASATLTKLGDLTVVTLPIGVAAGYEVPFKARAKGEAAPKPGTGASLISYIEPRLAYRRATLNGFRDVSVPFQLIAGSGISWRRLFGGVDFEWSPSESRTWAVGLRAAVGF